MKRAGTRNILFFHLALLRLQTCVESQLSLVVSQMCFLNLIPRTTALQPKDIYTSVLYLLLDWTFPQGGTLGISGW